MPSSIFDILDSMLKSKESVLPEAMVRGYVSPEALSRLYPQTLIISLSSNINLSGDIGLGVVASRYVVGWCWGGYFVCGRSGKLFVLLLFGGVVQYPIFKVIF